MKKSDGRFNINYFLLDLLRHTVASFVILHIICSSMDVSFMQTLDTEYKNELKTN